jgi:hypothetical protein
LLHRTGKATHDVDVRARPLGIGEPPAQEIAILRHRGSVEEDAGACFGLRRERFGDVRGVDAPGCQRCRHLGERQLHEAHRARIAAAGVDPRTRNVLVDRCESVRADHFAVEIGGAPDRRIGKDEQRARRQLVVRDVARGDEEERQAAGVRERDRHDGREPDLGAAGVHGRSNRAAVRERLQIDVEARIREQSELGGEIGLGRVFDRDQCDPQRIERLGTNGIRRDHGSGRGEEARAFHPTSVRLPARRSFRRSGTGRPHSERRGPMAAQSERWPELAFPSWAPTKKTLHLCTQLLGKLRLALSPEQPNWMHTALPLTSRGCTTGPIPWGDAAIEAQLDVHASALRLLHSDGRERAIALGPERTIADVYAAFGAALAELGVTVTITTAPQETLAAEPPFDRDRRPAPYDPADAQRWFAVVTAAGGTFERWRAHFFGRSAIQLWWGAFDLALLLFSGKHVPAPLDRGYLMKYDLDAEMLNVGFYPGDDAAPTATFYGYVYPEPPGCAAAAMPPGVTWSEAMHEWFLPYETVRAAADPGAALTAFCDALYAVATGAGGWDRAGHTYVHPPRR